MEFAARAPIAAADLIAAMWKVAKFVVKVPVLHPMTLKGSVVILIRGKNAVKTNMGKVAVIPMENTALMVTVTQINVEIQDVLVLVAMESVVLQEPLVIVQPVNVFVGAKIVESSPLALMAHASAMEKSANLVRSVVPNVIMTAALLQKEKS